MKRFALFALIILVCFCLSACIDSVSIETNEVQDETNNNLNEEAIVNLISDFGSKLQMVSLLDPENVVFQSIEEYYSDYITTGLLKKWQEAPEEAPGRMVSSPWPERIEITSLEKLADDIYEVKGEIIEITSAEKENGGFAAKRQITLLVKKIGDTWLIDTVILGAYDSNSIEYQNEQYGFNFTLPISWEGYKIVDSEWQAIKTDGDGDPETGLIILIRHPRWSEENPRQDIPIMVFTLDQWQALENLVYHIGAAPMNPSELGRNNKYVFALPARYNYSTFTGYEEVEEILNAKPLQTNDI